MRNKCDHRWKFTRDWMGDPTIPNGTYSWNLWVCSKCGDETDEQPDDWEDPRECEPDYERDKRIDDELTGDL